MSGYKNKEQKRVRVDKSLPEDGKYYRLGKVWNDEIAGFHYVLLHWKSYPTMNPSRPPYYRYRSIASGGKGWADRIAKHYDIEIEESK